ncbi:MAG: DNA recombination/repair protein RecA [Planctomycetes bacterium]|nr:DNA recombination/repair protein RecA [Planctomycetota bacterium]
MTVVHVGAGIRAMRATPARFCLAELAGRLVELAGEGASAALTLAMRLVREAQEQGEPVAWVTSDESSFYPPDAAESGVDLAALAVVRIRAAAPAGIPSAASAAPAAAPRFFGASRTTATAAAAARNASLAAERLLRSGAFGLVVLDLGGDADLALSIQSRLAGLAQRHHAALVCLTEKSEGASSLGSLVSLRAQAVRQWLSRDRFRCELRVLKDKRRGPTWSHVEVCRGPFGLR